MEKKDIIKFFDNLAESWDAEQIPKDAIIERILDNARIKEGISVLDVACGTGILFSYYLKRNVRTLVGIDISSKMVQAAKEKFPETEIICDDAEEYFFNKTFDVVMIYNAFPHFPNPENLIERLSTLLKTGGRLSVAHSMSREELQNHHFKKATKVSKELPTAEVLAKMFEPYFDVDVKISDNEMYQVSGVKR